jgi:cobyrinic acid a,c-diamide synthase
VDLQKLLSLTRSDEVLAPERLEYSPRPAPDLRIGVARDRAFGFYYAGDLEALEDAGAEVVPFDTLRDARLPEVDALFIGGGFPECFLGELGANAPLKREIRGRIEAGMPVYAECGGLMYLARSIEWKGERREMVGAIPADVAMRERPTGRGYVRLETTGAHPWWADAGSEIHAHEFHYSSLENADPALRYAYRVKRGHGIDGERDGIVVKNVLASYTHLRAAGGCDWPGRFVAFVRGCRSSRARVAGPLLSTT